MTSRRCRSGRENEEKKKEDEEEEEEVEKSKYQFILIYRASNT